MEGYCLLDTMLVVPILCHFDWFWCLKESLLDYYQMDPWSKKKHLWNTKVESGRKKIAIKDCFDGLLWVHDMRHSMNTMLVSEDVIRIAHFKRKPRKGYPVYINYSFIFTWSFQQAIRLFHWISFSFRIENDPFFCLFVLLNPLNSHSFDV